MTDGWTDGQTDRIILAIPRLHYMQRSKNGVGAVMSVKINLYSFMTSLGYSVSHVL